MAQARYYNKDNKSLKNSKILSKCHPAATVTQINLLQRDPPAKNRNVDVGLMQLHLRVKPKKKLPSRRSKERKKRLYKINQVYRQPNSFKKPPDKLSNPKIQKFR